MANISQEVNIEMLEKLADGSYKKKNPQTKASQVIAEDGSNLESHLAKEATQNTLGHIKLSDIPKPYVSDDTTGDNYKWGIDNGLVYLEKVVV